MADFEVQVPRLDDLSGGELQIRGGFLVLDERVQRC
jgi:hypothetical protein